MVGPLLFVVGAGLVFAVLGLSYKVAEATTCRPAAFTTVFMLVAAIFTGAGALFETTAWSDPRLWWLGLGMGLCACTNVTLVVYANQLGSAAVVWIVVNLALLVPIALAAMFLGESLLATDGLALVLFLLMLLVLSRGAENTEGSVPGKGSSGRFWLYVFGVFLFNGVGIFGFKLKDALFPLDSAAGLATVLFGSATMMAFTVHRLQDGTGTFTPSEWRAGLLAGACSGAGNWLMLRGASLPATVIYPVSQGIGLLGGVLLTSLIYRDRLGATKWAGVVLGLAVLILAAWREVLWRLIAR